jgi:hypothetical protein
VSCERPKITPRMIEAGISELRDHPLGVSLEQATSRRRVIDLITSVYVAMTYARRSEEHG